MKITPIETSSELFDLDEMRKDIKRAQWYLINIDTSKRSIKLTKPQLVEYVNTLFGRTFRAQDLDHRKIIAHDDVAYMILRDKKGDL